MCWPLFLSLFLVISQSGDVPQPVLRLMKAYPDKVVGYETNRILFADGTSLLYDDGETKTAQQLLEDPDIEDMFHYPYPKAESSVRNDAGRIRNDAFFRKLYGQTQKEVEAQLVTIDWCPKLVGGKIRVTRANGVDKAFRALSAELDRHPEFKPYLQKIGGTFNWRKVAGTSRMSAHSFGMTVDLNTAYSDYWQWDCRCTDEGRKLAYRNRIPEKLVAIFEKHGFIWGGKWEHYDTMHFEYRPELL